MCFRVCPPATTRSYLSLGVRGDISFGLVNATRSARLVQEFLQTYPAAKPLTIVMKTLLRGAGLNNVYSGGLSSYAITLLVISFLQVQSACPLEYAYPCWWTLSTLSTSQKRCVCSIDR